MWMTSFTGSARGGFWGFWKKSVGWVLRPKKKGDFSRARSGLVAGATRVGGGDWWKVSIERLCLSPNVEKPFNSKVIKSFVPELRSRKCFSCFGIPMFYLYILWTFYVRFQYPYHGYVTERTTALDCFTYSKFKGRSFSLVIRIDNQINPVYCGENPDSCPFQSIHNHVMRFTLLSIQTTIFFFFLFSLNALKLCSDVLIIYSHILGSYPISLWRGNDFLSFLPITFLVSCKLSQKSLVNDIRYKFWSK